MRATKRQLRRIIAEEHQRILNESLTKEGPVRTAVEQASYDIAHALEEIILRSDPDDDAYDKMITASTRLATRIQGLVYNAIMDFEEQLRRGQ